MALPTFFVQAPAPRDVQPRVLRPPVILEFDLPELPGGSQAGGTTSQNIRGFVVGYFPENAVEPRIVVEVERDRAEIRNHGGVRITLPPADIPAGIYILRARIRGPLLDSDWSTPSPPFRIVEPGANSARRPRPRLSGTDTADAAPPQLQLTPRLSAAVIPLLPKDVDLADATRGFRKPVQFVAMVLAARNLKIALPELKATMFPASAKPRTLGSALVVLRPEIDAKAEARKASQQAKAFVRENREGKPR